MQNRELEDVCSTNLNNTPVTTVRDLDAQSFLQKLGFFLVKARNSDFELSNK